MEVFGLIIVIYVIFLIIVFVRDYQIGKNNKVKTFDEKIDIINYAYYNKIKLKINYVSFQGEKTERIILPLTAVYIENNCAYVKAFCYLRNAERQFRISRITNMELLNDEIDITIL